MAPRGTPERRLGQPPGSVSPLAPGGLPVLVDRGLAGYDRVMVGAGRLGLDIELPLALLLTLSRGTWHAIAEPPKEG